MSRQIYLSPSRINALKPMDDRLAAIAIPDFYPHEETMEITGMLSEFPLPELLQFLGRRRVTGCLSLDIFSDYYTELLPQQYVIWLSQGYIVSVQRGSNPQDVYTLAVQKEWMSAFAAKKLKERSPNNVEAGMYLELQGALNFGQLRSLFFSEVVHRIENLCDVRNAIFRFHTTVELPLHEMTGLSIAATKVAKQGMRGDRTLKGLRANLTSVNDQLQMTNATVHQVRA